MIEKDREREKEEEGEEEENYKNQKKLKLHKTSRTFWKEFEKKEEKKEERERKSNPLWYLIGQWSTQERKIFSTTKNSSNFCWPVLWLKKLCKSEILSGA